jgi:hypothetical protein
MKRYLILLIVPIFITCNEKTQIISSSENLGLNIKETQDSLRNPSHYYYLSDIPPIIFANLILNDSINPSDNYSTFRVMDSLQAKELDDRKFYFKVFLNIMDKSDGALAEAIALPIMKYIEKHTKEFLELCSKHPNKVFDSIAHTVGLEIFLSSNDNPLDDAESFLRELKNNCRNCTSEQLEKIDSFNLIMIDAINQHEE